MILPVGEGVVRGPWSRSVSALVIVQHYPSFLDDADVAGPGRGIRVPKENEIAGPSTSCWNWLARFEQSLRRGQVHRVKRINVDADSVEHRHHEASAVKPALVLVPAAEYVRRAPKPLMLQPSKQHFSPVVGYDQAKGLAVKAPASQLQ